MIPAGAGKNPNNERDPGWDVAWNALLPPDAAILAQTQCTLSEAEFVTFGIDDRLPMNCISWYEAQAFCIWDGGRLPTETEWNYAAAGGNEQRPYPWGSLVPEEGTARAVWKCSWNGSSICDGVADIAVVGSISEGNGKYGQADLAGNLYEWMQDSPGTSIWPCDNCANLSDAPMRNYRGGFFRSMDEKLLRTDQSEKVEATSHSYALGARCARAR